MREATLEGGVMMREAYKLQARVDIVDIGRSRLVRQRINHTLM